MTTALRAGLLFLSIALVAPGIVAAAETTNGEVAAQVEGLLVTEVAEWDRSEQERVAMAVTPLALGVGMGMAGILWGLQLRTRREELSEA